MARLFERRPDICLNWLDELGLITPTSGEDRRHVSVSTQKSFVTLEQHGMGSRPDLIVDAHHAAEDAETGSSKDVVMIESKIGSIEEPGQLKKYAGHLDKMAGMRKTLVYITRAYDPKEKEEILANTQGVDFRQPRWHDFYTFLQKKRETDALVEEVMLFMKEQRMARSYHFSTTDLIALSGVPRAFEILDETIDSEVRGELESFTGIKLERDKSRFTQQVRGDGGYFIYASPRDNNELGCYLGFYLSGPNEYPVASVGSWVDSVAPTGNSISEIIGRMALQKGWTTYEPDAPNAGTEVWSELNLADVIKEEDHVAAVKRFFIESIHQLREGLTELKKENPDLPWNGGR